MIFIAESESDSISKECYEKTKSRNETWIKLLVLSIIKVSHVGITTPNLVISYFNYFSTDLGSDAFILPFPMWFVIKKEM